MATESTTTCIYVDRIIHLNLGASQLLSGVLANAGSRQCDNGGGDKRHLVHILLFCDVILEMLRIFSPMKNSGYCIIYLSTINDAIFKHEPTQKLIVGKYHRL